jgi:lactoylglutathione lyase
LTHNHGTEAEDGPVYHNGNSDPRGFGHIGVIVDDVYAFCDKLEAAGVPFQKKPDEGTMKGLAFAKTPGDEYWVEILQRTPGSAPKEGGALPVSFQQSMIRIKDPAVSVPFYESHFGMTVVCRRDFPDMKFSLFFMACLPAGTELPEPTSDAAWEWCLGYNGVTLELTHNHGTEAEDGLLYHNGNSDPRGFGHIAFLCDNLLDACDELDTGGVAFRKKPWEGTMKSIAFALDPDGYWIELIQRAAAAHKGVRPVPQATDGPLV